MEAVDDAARQPRLLPAILVSKSPGVAIDSLLMRVFEGQNKREKTPLLLAREGL
jgi:hypothetical protein